MSERAALSALVVAFVAVAAALTVMWERKFDHRTDAVWADIMGTLQKASEYQQRMLSDCIQDGHKEYECQIMLNGRGR